MDFFKSCTTNVYLIENLQQTRSRLYSPRATHTGDTETWTLVETTLTRLRELNVLCVRQDQGVYIFDGSYEEAEKVLAPFDMIEEDTVDFGIAKDKEHVKAAFLAAIEAALAFTLARAPFTVHIAPWTWICYAAEDDEQEAALGSTVTVHKKLIPPGAAYLIPEIEDTPWMPLNSIDVASGAQVLLAPYGKLATILPKPAKDTISGDTWTSAVIAGLHSRGLRLPEDDHWIAVQEHSGDDGSKPASFVWPSTLCLWREMDSQQESIAFDCHGSWRRWFESADQESAYRNPLAEAEQWFKGADELDAARQEANQAMEDFNTPAANTSSSNVHNADATTSSPFDQRVMEQQAAMAGIYPTPPDGLAQGPHLQFNAAATPSATLGDQAANGTDMVPTTSDDMPFPSFDHKQSIGAESYQMGAEDLFGDDAGEMEIGDNVDDADFNFFDDDDDEQPHNAALDDLDMTDQPIEEADPLASLERIVEGLQPQRELEPTTKLDDEPVNEPSPPPGTTAKGHDIRTDPQDAARDETSSLHLDSKGPPLEKPLSPFGIRERLLPPPVPASLAQDNSKENLETRRSNRFGPIMFRDSLDLGPRYSGSAVLDDEHSTSSHAFNIGLPQMMKKANPSKGDLKTEALDEDSESDEDSNESSSSESDTVLPPRTPWDMPGSRKRKRQADQDTAQPLTNALEPDKDFDAVLQHTSERDILNLLEKLHDALVPLAVIPREGSSRDSESPGRYHGGSAELMSPVEVTFDLLKDDLIYIAQIVGEQAATAVRCTNMESYMSSLIETRRSSDFVPAARRLFATAFDDVLPGVETCDVGKLVLTREPLAPARSATNPGKAPQQPSRPPQRAESMIAGPELFPLATPFVKIQRGKDHWEMLPACLSFWETLGLEPASGPKNVRAFCVFPDNGDLQHLVERFMVDIGTAYENLRLGTHVHHRNASAKDTMDNFEDGMAPVELTEEMSVEGALKSYANTCADLGKALSSISHRESERSMVVYLVNPFPGRLAIQHLCTCFWLLWKAYRDNLPKAYRNQCNSDIVLQVVPIALLASCDMLVVQDAKQMATLAREVYDRCPPTHNAQAADDTSALHILAAPSVELASSAPKRIGFQLAAEPPSDLLHDGSVLHAAYALSLDGEWLSAVWTDNTGRYQDNLSVSLRGRSFADGAEDVWDRTREIMAARKVTWRVFIVTHQSLDHSVSQCWRAVCGKPRAQPLCVTMLSVLLAPVFQVLPSLEKQLSGGQDGGFLTPVSTPQANNNFASSPADVGLTPTGNAPLTPAPSETAASIAENDSEAHLVDLTDETFALLYHSRLLDLAYTGGLASGGLFKRGEAESSLDTGLPSLGVNCHWTVQVKPDGKWDEGSARQAELTLREVLRMYRHLGLLTKARGLDREMKEVVPVHVEIARRGAEALEGMLSPVS